MNAEITPNYERPRVTRLDETPSTGDWYWMPVLAIAAVLANVGGGANALAAANFIWKYNYNWSPHPPCK